jgi:predicted transcriptional regulator
MLDIIITSKTRVKLLIKFFLVNGNEGYLRNLEKEFNESTNAVRVELNRFTKAGLLTTRSEGNRKIYTANTKHPLYNAIAAFVQQTVGIDRIVEQVTSRIGDLDEAYLTGNFARGLDSDTMELTLVGKDVNTAYIEQLVKKAEKLRDCFDFE